MSSVSNCKLVSYSGKRGLIFLAFAGTFALGEFTFIPWFGGVFGMACEGSCDDWISYGKGIYG